MIHRPHELLCGAVAALELADGDPLVDGVGLRDVAALTEIIADAHGLAYTPLADVAATR